MMMHKTLIHTPYARRLRHIGREVVVTLALTILALALIAATLDSWHGAPDGAAGRTASNNHQTSAQQ